MLNGLDLITRDGNARRSKNRSEQSRAEQSSMLKKGSVEREGINEIKGEKRGINAP